MKDLRDLTDLTTHHSTARLRKAWRHTGRQRVDDKLRVGRGAVRAEDAQGTPAQSHISPSILVYEEKHGQTTRG